VTRFWVDAWDPSYAAADSGAGGPTRESTAELDADVEVPAAAWTPLPYPADLRAPDTVLLVDGVRRTDARVWTDEGGGGGPGAVGPGSYAGLAVSYAAGVVRCDLRRGEAVLAGEPSVERCLVTASPTATDLEAGQVRYLVHRVTAGEPAQLSAAVQGPLTTLEVQVAAAARAGRCDPGDLLVVDGPLRGRTDLPRAIGYIKTHQRSYLPAELAAVVTSLAPGQRSPVFRLGTSWNCYTWYLRLPGGSGAPWSGLARIECSPELTVQAAVLRADLSVVTLPRFAASAYKDPRAPQNLVPIAGLEHRLRARLGDPALLHRSLLRAARESAGTPAR
jgi:hypothetical protein